MQRTLRSPFLCVKFKNKFFNFFIILVFHLKYFLFFYLKNDFSQNNFVFLTKQFFDNTFSENILTIVILMG